MEPRLVRGALACLLDARRIATSFVSGWSQHQDKANSIVAALGLRWTSSAEVFDLENDWAVIWRDALLERAQSEGGVLGAQIKAACRDTLSFLEEQVGQDDPLDEG